MINLIIGLSLGFILGVLYVHTKNFLRNKKILRGIENEFKNILDNFSKVSFLKRINQYVYFNFEKYELIYTLDSKEIHIFQNEKCIYTSNQILGNIIIKNLESKILEKWNKDINDVVEINNAIISVNLMKKEFRSLGVNEEEIEFILSEKKEETQKNEYNLDDVLDKINQVGYNNLTEEEKEFLKNVSK